MKNVLNENIGVNAIANFVSNENLNVGQVTVMNGQFVELISQVVSGSCDNAVKVFNNAFGDQVRDVEKYVSPVEVKEQDNLTVVIMNLQVAKEVYDRACRMKLTAKNMMLALYDLVAVERMFQEETIDAAKKGTDVVIPYAEGMQKTRLMSRFRGENDFGLRIDWDRIKDADKKAAVLKNGWKRKDGIEFAVDSRASHAFKAGENVKWAIKDTFHEYRVDLMKTAYKMAFRLKAKEQAADIASLNGVALVANKTSKDVKNAVSFVKQIYTSVFTIDQARKKELSTEYKDRNIREEKLKMLKADMKIEYAAVTNFLRVLTPNMRAEDRAALALSIVYAEKKKGEEVSSFASTTLPEEFLAYTLENYSDIKETKDSLTVCTFNDGDTVEFIKGFADGDNGEEAVAKKDIDGEFTIRIEEDENGRKHFYAVKSMREQIVIPDADPNQLVFITKMGVADKELDSTIDSIAGKEAVMVSKGDNLFVDGVNVGRFRCPAGGMITKFYKNKKGRVKFAISGKVENSLTHRMESVAIVVMDNVTTIDAAEAAKLESSIVAKKPVQKTNGYAFGAGLKVGGTATNAVPKKEYSFGKGLKGVQATAQPEAKPKYEFKGAGLVMPEGGNASF